MTSYPRQIFMSLEQKNLIHWVIIFNKIFYQISFLLLLCAKIYNEFNQNNKKNYKKDRVRFQNSFAFLIT